MSRKSARINAFSLLYQMNATGDGAEDTLALFYEENPELPDADREYIDNVVTGASKHLEQIDGLIEKNLKNWVLQRVAKVNLALLRLGVFEMLYRPDIPVSVTVNEVVELSKTYDDEKGGKFVNGVLGSISKELS